MLRKLQLQSISELSAGSTLSVALNRPQAFSYPEGVSTVGGASSLLQHTSKKASRRRASLSSELVIKMKVDA